MLFVDCGDLTIFKIAAARHLEFSTFRYCHVTSIAVLFCFTVQNFTEIGQPAAEAWPKHYFHCDGRRLSWILKIFIYTVYIRSSAVVDFQICGCAPNVIKIGWFFVEIWQFTDFKDGWYPPSWIFEIWSLLRDLYRRAILLKPMQNFTKLENRQLSYSQKRF